MSTSAEGLPELTATSRALCNRGKKKSFISATCTKILIILLLNSTCRHLPHNTNKWSYLWFTDRPLHSDLLQHFMSTLEDIIHITVI